MAAPIGVAVTRKSLQDFTAACERVGPDADRIFRDTFKEVGEVVRMGAAFRTVGVHAPTAAGYRTIPESDGVIVAQGLPKTTGEHGEWGSWQMVNALLPSLHANAARLAGLFWDAADEVADRFERS